LAKEQQPNSSQNAVYKQPVFFSHICKADHRKINTAKKNKNSKTFLSEDAFIMIAADLFLVLKNPTISSRVFFNLQPIQV
jgi:hypothetical protein